MSAHRARPGRHREIRPTQLQVHLVGATTFVVTWLALLPVAR